MTTTIAASSPAADADWEPAGEEATARTASILSGLAPQFEGWEAANLHAVLILHRGRLLHERYFTGEDWSWGTPLGRVAYRAGLRHDVRSISKSVTSLMVGIALGRGWIADVDTPVFDLFPEHADLRTPEKDRITLRHLLTMSAGLAWDESRPYSDPANSERRLMEAPDRCRYVLEQPVVRTPGAAYLYNGGLTELLAAVVARGGGRSFEALAAEHLFTPLGIGEVEWNRYADGTASAVSGLRLRPRDLARIGQMVLDGGQWQGRSVVPAAWIGESTRPHIQGADLYYYGYQWWLGRSLVAGRDISWVAGVGYGGQRLFIVPELELVVVVAAGLYDDPNLQDLVGQIVLRRYALPAAIELERQPAAPEFALSSPGTHLT